MLFNSYEYISLFSAGRPGPLLSLSRRGWTKSGQGLPRLSRPSSSTAGGTQGTCRSSWGASCSTTPSAGPCPISGKAGIMAEAPPYRRDYGGRPPPGVFQVRRLLHRQRQPALRAFTCPSCRSSPPGISFFTFTQIAYLVDAFRAGRRSTASPLRLVCLLLPPPPGGPDPSPPGDDAPVRR